MKAQAAIPIKQSLAAMAAKRQAGEGEVTTDSNHRFNYFSDEWVLGYKANKQVDMSFMHNLALELQIELRQSLANVCRWVALPRHYVAPIKQLLKLSDHRLTIQSLDSYIAWLRNKNLVSDEKLTRLRTLLDELSL
jgi:hypothetical protein